MKDFLKYLRPYKRDAALAVLCIELETVFELIIPLVMASIVDVGVASGDRHYILMKGLQMVFFALISLVLGQGSAMFSARCGQGVGAEIRKAEFAKLQQFSFANTDHFRSSSLVTRLTSDVTTIQNSLATGMRPGFRSPVMMLTAMVASFYINPKLALVFFVAAPVLGILLFLIISHVRPLYGVMQGAIDLVNRIIQENLTAIRVVKSYVRGDYEIQKFEQVNTNLRDTAQHAFGLAALNMPAMQFVMYSTILCILWFGGRLVTVGGVKVGELTGFLSYVLQVLNSLMMFSNVFLMTTRALASWKRISEVMDEEIDIKEDMALDLNVEQGDIRFEHVYFKYNKDAAEYVLSDISFHIKPGQTVGIIGQTGAAKSTLVQLIPRLYEATSGTVYIDGHPVQEYPLKHLRDSIAMVLQKNTLFSGTVKDNLRWGKEDATDEEIETACHIACVDEFIDRLERGYDTELGQGGVNVSGGQKQRLCIARAILKSPKVMILDDSTSAVDTATEARIREGLAQYMPGTTKIIIAQRISSVLHADQIIILEDGKINASGSHETLLATNRIYQEIYYSQQEGANL
ncbi:ABC transporter ATP-binding protein/permease [Enterocloster sp. OA13]|uniref:ABC transporter ATP-binding protein n=1 Tax=Enterocloster hominis (ex Hitch et al. 2024) TaxID=1917870 RepID=A0ABV1D0D9_9FIRM|nr:ABC transporter ATP-binding protein [Lachnoclostridium pacaense]EEQ57787.1 ABC transporter, ATP-binding protein [Clostridiales bacterium 1_7_47FAA]MCC2815703.1 ABC transporter ATP-binding protein/permease [Lachnoclostridium pacaense]MCH1950901.1 ABC transporter ATP-binding protein/permease [Enterocloster sp. OA13]